MEPKAFTVRIYKDETAGAGHVKVHFDEEELLKCGLQVGDLAILNVQGAEVRGYVSQSRTAQQTQTWLGTQGLLGRTHTENSDALKGVGLQAASRPLALLVARDSPAVYRERLRRDEIWASLAQQGDPHAVTPQAIEQAGVRPAKTGQGIFRDQARTASLAEHGVTVSLLDIGLSYDDAFDASGGVYHYPQTNRGTRDSAEIAATKTAHDWNLPVFVILPGENPALRQVRKGLVVSYDDELRLFYVAFNIQQIARPVESSDLTDLLDTHRKVIKTVATARPGQARFRFSVLKRYGARCALCNLALEPLLQAAHVVPWEHKGVDDPLNGLVLCHNHHCAWDKGFVAIDPSTLEVLVAAEECSRSELALGFQSLAHLRNPVSRAALEWRWTSTKGSVRWERPDGSTMLV